MKELILVRHAKSDWGNEYLKDIDRPLSERGYQDAYSLSEWYARNKVQPDLLVTSPAVRAISTAFIFLRQLSFSSEKLSIQEGIFESPASHLFEIIQALPKNAERIMMFGHNPGFTDLSNQLSEEHYFENVPTCGIVSFQFDVKKWTDVEARKGRLAYYQFPKDFKNLA